MVTATPWPAYRIIPESDWRPPAGTRVISADDHLDEVDHLWEDRLPAALKDRAPKIWRDERDIAHMEIDGASLDVPGLSDRPERTGAHDLRARIRDMDAEGIDASIVFHQKTPALYRMQDPDLLYACLDVFNEWFAEHCRQPEAQGRVHPVAILPTWMRPEATRDYVEKIKALGFKAMELPSEPRDTYWNSSRMEPMWAGIEQSGMPISFHVGAHIIFRGAGAIGANLTRNMAPYRPLWALLAFSGVLERHPAMKVVFTEGGASWVAPAIDDADKVYKAFEPDMSPKLAELPSFYWRRQCYATFMEDASVLPLIDRIGAENVMWSVDYPHPESVLGKGRKLVQSFFDALGPERAAMVAGGNASRVWGI